MFYYKRLTILLILAMIGIEIKAKPALNGTFVSFDSHVFCGWTLDRVQLEFSAMLDINIRSVITIASMRTDKNGSTTAFYPSTLPFVNTTLKCLDNVLEAAAYHHVNVYLGLELNLQFASAPEFINSSTATSLFRRAASHNKLIIQELYSRYGTKYSETFAGVYDSNEINDVEWAVWEKKMYYSDWVDLYLSPVYNYAQSLKKPVLVAPYFCHIGNVTDWGPTNVSAFYRQLLLKVPINKFLFQDCIGVSTRHKPGDGDFFHNPQDVASFYKSLHDMVQQFPNVSLGSDVEIFTGNQSLQAANVSRIKEQLDVEYAYVSEAFSFAWRYLSPNMAYGGKLLYKNYKAYLESTTLLHDHEVIKSIGIKPVTNKTISPSFLGFNADHLFDIGMGNVSDPKFIEASSKLLAGSTGATVRWPGGGYANYFDWGTGTFIDNATLNALNLTNPYHERTVSLSLEGFISYCRDLKASPIVTLNVLSSNLSYQLQLVEILVKKMDWLKPSGATLLLELGNELYIPIPNYQNVFPTAQSYSDMVTSWIPQLRKAAPNALIAINGAIPCCNETRRISWNANVLGNISEVAWPDAVTLHVYESPPHPYLNSTCPSFAWGKKEQQLAEAAYFNTSEGASDLFAVPQKYISEEYLIHDLPENVSIWFDEFGIIHDCGALRLTWLHGMATVLMTLKLALLRSVTTASVWILSGNSEADAIFPTSSDGENMFSGLCCGWDKPTLPGALTGIGFALSQVSLASASYDHIWSLDFVNSTNSSLFGVGFGGLTCNTSNKPHEKGSESICSIIVLNLSPESNVLQVPSSMHGLGICCHVSHTSGDLLRRPNGFTNNVTNTIERLNVSNPVCISPAYSIIVISPCTK
eukprot:m.232484 g.232484  ORF g.232484 m.232484 type:complete len:866 (+) comp16018_c0_seq5:124-2721(+)